jgi:L-threonylcarbamoyladenylate synthase
MKKREISRFSADPLKTEFNGPDDSEKSAAIIRAGGIVAFPTETSYGLAVDPFNGRALNRLFTLKRRPPSKPVLVIIDRLERLGDLVCNIPAAYEPLMNRFWPGPLTLIFPALSTLPRLLTAGTATIGVRISSHRLATRICHQAGGAVTATSANISGRRPALGAAEIQAMFGGLVDKIVDGGVLEQAAPSTIVTELNGQLKLIREGALPFADIAAVSG